MAYGRTLVTFVALNSSVSAEKREAILVIFHLLDSGIPAANRMTLLAIGAEFPPVNVCMAIGAGLANISENRLDVALRAFHFFVHAAQWVISTVVIKLWIGANRTPTARRVAIFARDCKRSMRAARALALARRWQSEPGNCNR